MMHLDAAAVYANASRNTLRQSRLVNPYAGNSCPPVGPPSPAPPPGQCVGGWPKFDSQAALQGNAGWSKYFQALYGEIPGDSWLYPLCLGDFWMFHTNLMQSSGVTGVPQSVGDCPTNRGQTPGQYYWRMSGMQPPNVAWSWHPLPHIAFPDNQWVEVIHKKLYIGDEQSGSWFFYARGGGIWFNLGKTIAFQDHGGAYRHFGTKKNPGTARAAANAGYDSLQFLHHSDVEFRRCRDRPGQGSMNYEFVSTKLIGKYACASSDGKSNLIRAGWMGNKACICDNSQAYINCQGTPQYSGEVVL